MTIKGNDSTAAARLKRIDDAIALKEPDRIPFVPFFDGVMQRMYGSSFADNFYDYRKAGDAAVSFYKDHPLCDAYIFGASTTGRANAQAWTY